jgi:hypothetical protein
MIARRTQRAAAFAAVVSAVLMPLTGCGGGNPPVNSGPLGDGGSWDVVCFAPMRPGQVVTVGSTGGLEVANSGSSLAIIDQVKLTDPRNVRLLHAYAVLHTGPSGFGDMLGFPSRHELLPGVHWSQRQRADGARIAHESGDDGTALVLVVELMAKVGTTRGFNVQYHTSSGQYQLQVHHDLTLADAQKCPARQPT